MRSGSRIVLSVFVSLVLAGAGVTLVACGGGAPDPHYPYGSFDETVVGTMTGTLPLLGEGTYQAGVVGETEIGGRTYSVYLVGHDIPQGEVLTAATPGTAGYVRGLGTDTLTLGGIISDFGLEGIADPPIKVDLNPPVGVVQTLTTSANITTTTDPVGRPATFEATYTLVEDNVTMSTAHFGTVTGVRHFQGTVAISGEAIPAAFTSAPADIDVWYHPTLGVVDVKSPSLGIDLSQEAQMGWTEPDAGGVTVGRMLAVLDPTNLNAGISTYDRAQAADADMCVHTKMLAEVRWANESDALTLGEPDPTLFEAHFEGGWGQFCWGACPLVESSISYFHPEENGKGYRFWYVYVDEALKNEYVEGGDKGSIYSISFFTDASLPPIRVTARISTTLASDASDCSM